jgi:DNA-binding GntR family transcriptional regulator
VLERARPEEQRIVIELTGATSRLLAELEQRDAHVTHFETSDEADRHVVTLELDHVTEELAAHLADLDYVVGVRWHR